MKNDRSRATVRYMLRHFLTFNITDPMSEESRGSTEYTQYFSGTGASGQINYIERKPSTGGRFDVYVKVGGAWVKKALTTDYTYSNGQIAWGGFTPATGTNNIKLVMTAIMPWI